MNTLDYEHILGTIEAMVGIGYWHIDLINNSVFWSDEVFKIHDVPKEYGVPALDKAIEFYHPDDRHKVEEHIEKSINEKIDFKFELTIITLRGDTKIVRSYGQPILNENGDVVKLIGAFMDITQERTRLQETIDNQQLLNLAIDAGNLGFWDWDLKTNQVSYSEGWVGMLGYKPDEIINDLSTWETLIHPEDFEIAKEKIEAYLKGTSPVYETEFRMQHKDGYWKWILARGKLFTPPDEIGNPRLMGSHTDITELKNIQAEMQQQQAMNVQASKLALIGQLSAGIAHEINNPLAIVAGYNQQLQKILGDTSPEIQDILTKVEKATRRITDIIKNMKTLSHNSESHARELHNIEELIDESMMFASTKTYEVGATILKNLQADLPRINVNRVDMVQVLLNLIVNALDATKDQRDKIIEITAQQQDDKIFIKVCDSGPGIPEKNIENLFAPFFTTKAIGEGTGLGLSVSHSIIKNYGGQLYLDPNASKTTFVIELNHEQ